MTSGTRSSTRRRRRRHPRPGATTLRDRIRSHRPRERVIPRWGSDGVEQVRVSDVSGAVRFRGDEYARPPERLVQLVTVLLPRDCTIPDAAQSLARVGLAAWDGVPADMLPASLSVQRSMAIAAGYQDGVAGANERTRDLGRLLDIADAEARDLYARGYSAGREEPRDEPRDEPHADADASASGP